ncbi:MAG: DUF2934 domain-containing protein [Myxococcales bacterium]|nr:DUF2934 domain-containing protein [Myxococcales bacterium]
MTTRKSTKSTSKPKRTSKKAAPETASSAVRRRPSKARKTTAPLIIKQPAATPSQDDIARRAYQLWQMRGCVDGFHVEDWLQAERELS